MDILKGLNVSQRKGVEQTNGPVMIVAGPGTGKTKTLTTRIAYLILDKKISPENILAITFTKKAAAEMKDRLSVLLGSNNVPPTTTFHALGYSILSYFGKEINLISDRKRYELLSELKEKYKLKSLTVRDISLLISLRKSSHLDDDVRVDSIDKLFIDYQRILEEDKLLDYDDLLLKTFDILRTDSTKLASLQNTYQYVLVDEFQDTNSLQYELIKLLVKNNFRHGSNNNLFVIGDPLQSIYSFRGANSQIFEQLRKDFTDCIEVTLTDNYRSHQHVIKVSSLLFPDTPELHPHTDQSGRVSVIKTMHEYSEADWIVNDISSKVGGTDLLQAGENKSDNTPYRFSDFAVIYRTHQLSHILEKRFSESGIPFQIIGENSPYHRPDIAFIISVLKYLDKNTEAHLENITAVKTLSEIAPILTALYSQRHSKLSDLIEQIISQFNLKDTQQFQNTMLQFDSQENALTKAVEYLTYLEEHEFYDPTSDKVTLLTIHAVKGLEFKQVYICGFEEGIIPLKNADDVEEEKRLLYVAMTRAKEELNLLYTKERNKKASVISRFNELLTSPQLLHFDDEAITKIEKKRKKWQDKKSQMELF